MSNRLNAPPTHQGAHDSADLLADLIAAAHQGTTYQRSDYPRRWGLRFDGGRHRGFHIVARGACWLRLCGADGPPLRLEAGDLALVSVPHELLGEPDAPVVLFSPARAEALQVPEEQATSRLLCGAYLLTEAALDAPATIFDHLPPLIHVPRQDRDPAIGHLVALLDLELARQEPGARTVISRLIDALLMYILRHWIERGCPLQLGWLRALRDPTLARALTLIHQHPAQPWTLDALARASHTSRATLARRFTAEVGVPPMTYLTTRRMALARHHLVTSPADTLDEVAARVGYTSGFALSKAYKRAFGHAPRAVNVTGA